MGNYVSHSDDVESPCPGSEERKNLHRFFDPRSPSVEINRTPILVQDPINRVLDPRSPSEAIDRTPITYQLPQKFRKPGMVEVSDIIPPLRFEEDLEDSQVEENNDSSPSLITEIDGSNGNDSHLQTVKIIPNEKVEETPEEKPQEVIMPSPLQEVIMPSPLSEMMPSPILPLEPNEHYINTPGVDILTSTTIANTDTTTITTSTKLTNPLVSKSKIPAPQVTKKASALPTMMPLAKSKKKSDFQTGKGFGWKKSGGGVFTSNNDSEGRSPLLNRNRDNLAFSPLQMNARGKIQPSYRQNPVRGRGKDVENVFATDLHNKENVTILWEN